VLYEELAAGGMGAVHLGKVAGSAGFARAVAIKRLHAHLAKDQAFREMLIDEARVAARIRHPNVVPTLDVVEGDDGELLLVMEFVVGESLSRLVRAAVARAEPVPIPVAVAIVCDALRGLHAAHEASSATGEPLRLVHRDVSPQNVLVGVDGSARVLDFGIAKAVGRLQATGEGQIKGKVSYMAPEQIRGEDVDRRADVFGAAVVAWELLASRRLFEGDSQLAVMTKVLAGAVPDLREIRPDVPEALEAAVRRGLSESTAKRFATAHEMAVAIEAAVTPASSSAVARWLDGLAHDTLESRRARIAAIERDASEPVAEPTVDEVPTQLTGFATPREAKPPRRALIAVLAIVGAAAIAAAGMRWVKPTAVAPTASSVVSASAAPVLATATTPTPTVTASAPATTDATASTHPQPVHAHAPSVVTRAPASAATGAASSPPEPRKCLRKIPDEAGVLIPTYVPCD